MNYLKSSNIIKVIFIVSLILIVVFAVLAFRYFDSSKRNNFINKINLPLNQIVSFNRAIENEYIVFGQGKLFCVSLESQEIYTVDLTNGTIENSLKYEGIFKTVKFMMLNDIVCCIFDNNYLYLIDPITLKVKNIYYDKKARYYNTKTYFYKDVIIASDNESSISVISLNNGEVIASKKVSQLRNLELKDDILFYQEAGFNIFAVEPYTLNLIWKYVENYDQHVLARVAYEDKQIYFNNVVSTKVFDEKNGKVLSEFPLHATRISFFDKNLYSFIAGKNVQSVDAVNGNVVWNAEVNTGAIFILNDSIFLIDKSKHELKKLDRFTGNLIWRTSWNNQKVKRIEEINKYNIIQDADDSIYLVNKSSGDKLWSFSETLNSKKMFWSQYNRYLFISNGKDKIYIYDTEKVVNYATQNPTITPSLNVETEK